MAKWSELHNGKFPDPYAKLKFEDPKKEKKKRKKTTLREKLGAKPIDANGNKVRNKTCVSSMIPSARPTVSPIAITMLTRNFFCDTRHQV